jgi:putative ABC transport system permease protein
MKMWNRIVAVCARLRFAWARTRIDDEARGELREHIVLLADRYVSSGMTRAEAEAAARRQFGNPTLVREEIFTMNGIAWLDVLRHDLRYALRQIRHSPIFAGVVIATLAVGIGGTTAVFSVVQGVLLEPLPYESPGELVRLYQHDPQKPDTRSIVTGLHFKALRDETTSFEAVAAIDANSETFADLVQGGQPVRIRVPAVTSDYFRVLRASPLHGPGFDRSDDTGTQRVVLSDAVWRERFNSDALIVGSAIRLNAVPFEVVGIAPPGFEDPSVGPIAAWLPYDLAEDNEPQNYSLTAVGRLRDGVTVSQANAELSSLAPSMKARWPSARLSSISAVPLKEDLVGGARRPLQLFLIAVGLVLLVACVNVANLVLVRATGRVHEFALRAALGSSRVRMVTQSLVENVLLAAVGGALGLFIARVGVSALRRLGEHAVPRLQDVGFHPAVLAFAAAVTAGTAIASGLAPALRLGRVASNQALRQQSRSASGTRAQSRARVALAAIQVALALTLLVGAAVLVTSFYGLQQVNVGFRTDNVLTFELGLPSARYDAARRIGFQEELSHKLQGIPGVIAAGATSRLPATGNYHPWFARPLTGPRAGISIGRGINLQNRTVSGSFFEALNIPVLAGRLFDERDDAKAPRRVVVGTAFAREAYPGMALESIIGQRVAVLGGTAEIVGVAGDVAFNAYGASALVIYHPHRQFGTNRNWMLTHVVATEVPPEQILTQVRAAVRTLDPELVVHRPMALADVVGRGVARERFALVLMASFAAVALLLAVLGLYGVLAYGVRQRTQEIGIRIALGASSAQIRALVLRQAAAVLGIGLAFGLGGALALGRWLSALVFQISPSDPWILSGTAAMLAAVGLVAAWLPARRAAQIEPRTTMQET